MYVSKMAEKCARTVRNQELYCTFFPWNFRFRAYSSGVSIKKIMNAANWSLSKTFFKFYYKGVNIAGCDTDGQFANSVLNG